MVKFDKLYEVDGEKIDIMAENWDYLIILDACRVGMVGLRKAYKENLELVLGYVAELSESLPGNFLITADHGELLREV